MSIVAPSEDSARLRLRKALQLAPLFADLDTKSMAAIEGELSLLLLPGGAPLFRQGEPADAVYVVASGCLGVFRHEDEDSAEERIVGSLDRDCRGGAQARAQISERNFP